MILCLKQLVRRAIMVLTNSDVYINIIIIFAIIVHVLHGCTWDQEMTSSIYDYIKNNKQHRGVASTICLNDVFNVDSDTIYFFLSYQVTYSAVRNITGVTNYKESVKPDVLVGNKFDAWNALFVKGGKVVYESEFYNGNNNIVIDTYSLKEKEGRGEFDGDKSFPFSLFYTNNCCMNIELHENKYVIYSR